MKNLVNVTFEEFLSPEKLKLPFFFIKQVDSDPKLYIALLEDGLRLEISVWDEGHAGIDFHETNNSYSKEDLENKISKKDFNAIFDWAMKYLKQFRP